MKNIPVLLKESYLESVQHLCMIMKLTLKDGRVFGFNDVDKDLLIDNVLYKKSNAISPSAITSTSSNTANNLELKGLIDDQIFTIRDIRGGIFSGAKVEFRRLNYKFPQFGYERLPSAFIGDITVENNEFTMELRGLAQIIQNDNERIYMPACDADFGDKRCGVDLNALTVTGTAEETVFGNIITDKSRTEAENYFNGGIFTFTSGDNDNYSLEIKNFKDGVFELYLPFTYEIRNGDTYKASPGCDKTFETCKIKNPHPENFKGFPSIPSPDIQFNQGGS